MGATYAFVTRWEIDADAERCWDAIEGMLRPGARVAPWWPGVSIADRPRAVAVGERLALAVRSPLGYALRMRLTLTQVEPGRVLAAESDGDLHGTGRIEVIATGASSCTVVIDWSVETRRPWMNATAGILRPLFERAHARVMRRGERGLRALLAGTSQT